MASYLRPRRGQKSTAETQAIVLKKGEVFFEIGNGGTPTTYASSAAVATGKSFGKIKMGNGTNTYQTLGYFIDVDTTVVAWTDPYPNNATSAAQGSQLYANLNAINTSANVKTIFNNIKSLLYKMATQVTKLNNDLSKKRDKPTTGVIQLSSSECVPTAIGQAVSYQNNLIVDAKKVSVFISGRSVTLDTLNGFMEAQYAYWDNTIPSDSSITCVDGANYWRGKVLVDFARRTGTITINVQAKGNSFQISDLKVTYIYYEK